MAVIGALVVTALATGAYASISPAEAPPESASALSVDQAATVAAPARRMLKAAVPPPIPDPGKLAFPMNPAPRCEVLDNFGDPRSGGRRHEGIDILATLGQEVYAVADGTLTQQIIDGSSGSSLSGNMWRLTMTDKTVYVYAHLSGFAAGLTVGSKVKVGELIGYVGDTGNPGPGNYHLHFEVHPLGGSAVNALPLLSIPAGCKVY